MLIWLGSNNNKGQATPWNQGVRAIGRCASKEIVEPAEKRNFEVTIDDIYILQSTVRKEDLLKIAPDTYTQFLTNASIVGINNYASQVVQMLSPSELAIICAMIASIQPDSRDEIEARVPDVKKIQLSSPAKKQLPPQPNPPELQVPSLLSDTDPILGEVRRLLIDDEMGGVMIIGSPGTGKTWYARQIALKLANGYDSHIREVQFHPSYQYEDFVEGFVPDKDSGGFRLVDKHLLQMISAAQKTSQYVVMIIDEFSRTDPARVLGETMTYMEGSLRGKDFFLPSGRIVNIPKNLIFLATMNPEDRSVDEIDAAMERRWAKVRIRPDADKVRDFLIANGMDETVYGPIIEFFAAIQSHIELGHAFFRTIRNVDSLNRLWNTQLEFVVQKRFRFDASSLSEVEKIWATCLSAATVAEAALAATKPTSETAADSSI